MIIFLATQKHTFRGQDESQISLKVNSMINLKSFLEESLVISGLQNDYFGIIFNVFVIVNFVSILRIYFLFHLAFLILLLQ